MESTGARRLVSWTASLVTLAANTTDMNGACPQVLDRAVGIYLPLAARLAARLLSLETIAFK